MRLSPSVETFITIVESSTNFKIMKNPIFKPWFDQILKGFEGFKNVLIEL